MKMLLMICVIAAVVAVGRASAESLVVDDVTSGEPWSTITVRYTLSGVDADLNYKVAFDITANGVMKSVTNAAVANLTSGTYTNMLDTVALFGEQRTDPKAKVCVSLIAVKSLGGVQLWENGPYWAECNVGARKPEEQGYHFWWGDTVGYKRNAGDTGWISVKDGTMYSFAGDAVPTMNKDTSQLQLEGYIDSTGNLVAVHDAATAHLGARWRMPTELEITALVNNCTITWITTNGVCGRLVSGMGNYAAKSIFLPAAGVAIDSDLNSTGSLGGYWSSTPYSGSSDYACGFYFSSVSINLGRDNRYYGQSVRPVRGFAQ